MKKTLFLFAAATMVCSAKAQDATVPDTIKAAATLGNFDPAGVTPKYENEGDALDTLQIAVNPDKTGLNATDSSLYAHTLNADASWWKGVKITPAKVVKVGDQTRYLHVMMYTNLAKYEFNLFAGGESYQGSQSVAFANKWFDVVIDMDDLKDKTLTGFRIALSVNEEQNRGKGLYIDEIVVNNDPTPRGAITAAATLGNFETITPKYAIEDNALSTLQVAKNPSSTTTWINSSDSSLHAHTKVDASSTWGGLRIIPAADVEVNEKTRYLHVMLYTDLKKYEFNLFSSKGEDWMGKDTVSTTNKWFDYVVDLYSKDLEGKTLNSFRISTVSDPANLDKDLYVDEIEVNSDSLPRVPTVTISLNNNNVSVAKGTTQQFTASVTVAYGATPGISWSVTGGTAGTSIDTGTLIVAADETARKLTVTATSVFDGTKDSVTVLIGEDVTKDSGADTLATFEVSANDLFDATNSTWSTLTIVANPDTTGINTTDSCLLNIRPQGQSWTDGARLFSSLGDFVTVDSGRYLHVMVYSPEITSGMLFIRATNNDDQWANEKKDVRFDFAAGKWKDVVMDLRSYDNVPVYGFYFLSQDWGGAPEERKFYYDEIVVNDDPTPRGESLVTTSSTLGDFESAATTPDYLIEGSAFDTLYVEDNPAKTGINPTDKALYGLSSDGGESWGGVKVILGNVLVNDETRYLHVMMKTNVPHYEFDIFPMSGEGGEMYAGADSVTNLTSWFEHVVDLYNIVKVKDDGTTDERNFKGCVLNAFRVVVDVKKEENQGKYLYLDEIKLNSDPTPLAPSVEGVTITPASPEVAKGDKQQFAAKVTVTYEADTSVTWSVTGGVNATDITAAGLLRVAATETAASLTVIATSVYDNTKSATASVTVTAATTAVEKMQRFTPLSVYPNPTTGVAYVENEADGEVSVYSVKGELLLRTVGRAVDLSGLPGGVYVIKAGGKVAKVVKK